MIEELVPGVATVVDDVVVGFEDPVGQPIVAQELPDILRRIEFGTFCRQRDDSDIWRDGELVWQKARLNVIKKKGVVQKWPVLGGLLDF